MLWDLFQKKIILMGEITSSVDFRKVVNDQVMICICVSVSVAKPLVADGSAKSHELSLAYDQNSLQKLEPPLVLQEFVNHGMRFNPCVLLPLLLP